MNSAFFTDLTRPSRSELNLDLLKSSTETQRVQQHTLSVHITKKESRVETQIPIKLVLSTLPQGVTKLRLPSHCISKLKSRALSFKPSDHTLQLYTSVVCSSKTQGREQLMEAFARAQRLQKAESSDDREVKICPTCMNREEKRYMRRKYSVREKDDYFQATKDKRLILFSAREIQHWREYHENVSTANVDSPVSCQQAMQVDLPMRITCCCCHHDEKQGFRVIFTVKDHTDNVIAQAITKPIMIAHKRKSHKSPPL
jgi:hypothetical protein